LLPTETSASAASLGGRKGDITDYHLEFVGGRDREA